MAFHEGRLKRLEGLLNGSARTPYELMRDLFPRLGDAEVFLGLSEVVGHLEVLEERGRVEAVRNGEVLLYRKA